MNIKLLKNAAADSSETLQLKWAPAITEKRVPLLMQGAMTEKRMAVFQHAARIIGRALDCSIVEMVNVDRSDNDLGFFIRYSGSNCNGTNVEGTLYIPFGN